MYVLYLFTFFMYFILYVLYFVPYRDKKKLALYLDLLKLERRYE